MIRALHIENFKSLVQFDLPSPSYRLGNFVCLIGMNGSGKSTVLQALDFLAELVRGQGRVGDWLAEREWQASDLPSQFPREPSQMIVTGKGTRVQLKPSASVVAFGVTFKFEDKEVVWRGHFNCRKLRCDWERVEWGSTGNVILCTDLLWDDEPEEAWVDTDDLIFEGSVMSVHKSRHPMIRKIREFLTAFKSLELLTPQAMRRPARKGGDIGYGGEQLAPFLDSLGKVHKEALAQEFNRFYPQVERVDISTARGGWKKLTTQEHFGKLVKIPARHMNDGMLRVLAILAQAHSNHPVLLFDEIENGINPELVEKLVDFLVGMKKQVFVTTHSPMILNYLEDDVARESVHLLYRDENGWTRSTRFFDIPETSEKLKALGPGEVFVDTNLTKLTKRLGKMKHSPRSA
jgi:predicted ATPase